MSEKKSNKDYIGLCEKTESALNALITVMFPYHFGKCDDVEKKRKDNLEIAEKTLRDALEFVKDECADDPDTVVKELFTALPGIYSLLETDLRAAYEGDPAAKSTDEIILSYPAFKAISTYRIAHRLYELKVYLIPRIMTEIAHEKTGIDIHPGASIGPYFFIDHGTGVVIGETTTIGERVKLYQHVTLGAKSFAANEDGSLVKGIKRHPDIGNNVVIYAGATILGGNTRIGDNCVIGGNVWLTHSLADNRTITFRAGSEEEGGMRQITS